MAQLQIFFAYFFFTFAWFRSSRLVSIEGDRRLEGSSAQHAMCIYAVGVYTYGIYGGSYRVNYVVYVWTGRMCWGVGVRYIYNFYNSKRVRGDMIYDICFNTLTHMVTLLCLTIKILVICEVLVRSLR